MCPPVSILCPMHASITFIVVLVSAVGAGCLESPETVMWPGEDASLGVGLDSQTIGEVDAQMDAFNRTRQ